MDRTIATILSERLGGDWIVRPHGGSTFCSTWRAQSVQPRVAGDRLFIKATPSAQGSVLEAEADGLTALAAMHCIRSPAVAGCWVDASRDLVVLAMEWLELSRDARSNFGERFGRQLATLHRAAPVEGNGRFGWRRDNWLGGTPQRNRWSKEEGRSGWLTFFAEERLRALAEKLSAASTAAALIAAVDRVIAALPAFFADGHLPRPSLIHGDLWNGNWSTLADGSPVIFDPAVSISDAEAELAMMELFGAPPAGFWPAYREIAPVHDGYAERRKLYQLYHLLNHALLFGASYARQAMAVVDALLAGHPAR